MTEFGASFFKEVYQRLVACFSFLLFVFNFSPDSIDKVLEHVKYALLAFFSAVLALGNALAQLLDLFHGLSGREGVALFSFRCLDFVKLEQLRDVIFQALADLVDDLGPVLGLYGDIRLEKTDFLLDLFGKLAFRLLSLFYFVVELGTQFLLKVVEFALAVFHLIAKPE